MYGPMEVSPLDPLVETWHHLMETGLLQVEGWCPNQTVVMPSAYAHDPCDGELFSHLRA